MGILESLFPLFIVLCEFYKVIIPVCSSRFILILTKASRIFGPFSVQDHQIGTRKHLTERTGIDRRFSKTLNGPGFLGIRKQISYLDLQAPTCVA